MVQLCEKKYKTQKNKTYEIKSSTQDKVKYIHHAPDKSRDTTLLTLNIDVDGFSSDTHGIRPLALISSALFISRIFHNKRRAIVSDQPFWWKWPTILALPAHGGSAVAAEEAHDRSFAVAKNDHLLGLRFGVHQLWCSIWILKLKNKKIMPAQPGHKNTVNQREFMIWTRSNYCSNLLCQRRWWCCSWSLEQRQSPSSWRRICRACCPPGRPFNNKISPHQ